MSLTIPLGQVVAWVNRTRTAALYTFVPGRTTMVAGGPVWQNTFGPPAPGGRYPLDHLGASAAPVVLEPTFTYLLKAAPGLTPQAARQDVQDQLAALTAAFTDAYTVAGVTYVGDVGYLRVASSDGTTTYEALARLLKEPYLTTPGKATHSLTVALEFRLLSDWAPLAAPLVTPVTPPPTGSISTLIGTGTAGSAPFASPVLATALDLLFPWGCVYTSTGDLYFTQDETVYVLPHGSSTVQIAVGTTDDVFGEDGDGGLATAATMATPAGLAVDATDTLYIAENDGCVIRRVDHATGIITTVAGVPHEPYVFDGNGGLATAAHLLGPADVAVNAAGDLFIADASADQVRRVDHATGIIAAYAGTAVSGSSGDGGPAVSARLSRPVSVSTDGAGNLYIGDSGNAVVRRVDAITGIITTVAGGGSSTAEGVPATTAHLGIAGTFASASAKVLGGVLYVVDHVTGVRTRIRAVDLTTGLITTVAGTLADGYGGDGGPATSAVLSTGTVHLAQDPLTGTVVFPDAANHRIRAVAP